jgi:hypothetical protein
MGTYSLAREYLVILLIEDAEVDAILALELVDLRRVRHPMSYNGPDRRWLTVTRRVAAPSLKYVNLVIVIY